jgi:phage-related protein
MTTEELKIRITADTVGVESSVNKVKQSLNGINGKKAKEAGDAVSTSMESVRESIDKLRNMTAIDVLTNNLENLAKVSATVKGSFKNIGENIKVTFSNLIPSAYENGEWKGWKKAFQDFAKDGKVSFKSLKSDLSSVGASFKQVFTGIIPAGAGVAVVAILGVVAAVAAVTAAIKNAINTAQRLRTDFFDARKVGLSTKTYKEWGYVLNQVGVEADALSDFIKSLSAAQNDLRDGSEAMTEAFQQLGFNIDEVVNMGQEELFVETIKRLQQLEDQVLKTSIAYRIFGEDDAAKVANVLALNNEEMERMINNYYLLGGGASDAAIQKSLTLSGAVNNMKLAWQGLSQTLGEVIMPVLTKIVNAITVTIAAINMFLRALFGLEIIAKGSSSSGVNKAAASVGGYSSAIKDATAAAKELKRTTMGFDELNVVSDPNKDTGGGAGSDAGSIGGGGGSFEMPELEGLTQKFPGLEKFAAWLEEWKSAVLPVTLTVIGVVGGLACLFTGNFIGAAAFFAMAGLGISIGIKNGAWKKIGDSLVKVWEDVKKKLKTKWDDMTKNWKKFWDDFGKKCKEGLEKVKKWFEEKWKDIKDNWTKFCDETKKKWDKFWSDVAKATSEGLEKVKKWFTEKFAKIKSDFTKFCEDTKKAWDAFWTDVKKKVNEGLEAVKKFFSDGWEAIKTKFNTFVTNTKQAWDNFWTEVKKKVNDGIEAVKKFFSDGWESIKTTATQKWNDIQTMLSKTWEDIKKTADDLCANLKKFFEDAWKKIKETWDVVKQYFKDIWDNIKTNASSMLENVKTSFSNAWTNIKTTWGNVKTWFSDIWTSIKNTASTALENVKTSFSNAWTNIKNTWSSVTTWFSEKWTGIKNVFSGVSTYFGDKFGSAVTTIKQKWSDIKEWFQEKWNSVKSVFTSAGTSIGSSITTALKNSFNNFMSSAVGKINNFIDRLNSAITLINKIPGVNIGTINHLNVPQLAKGGIVTGSILANIGERGKEAVLPLENNTSWMDILADRIAARSGPTRVVLQVDGRELGWATIENINSITKQTGGLQLTLV